MASRPFLVFCLVDSSRTKRPGPRLLLVVSLRHLTKHLPRRRAEIHEGLWHTPEALSGEPLHFASLCRVTQNRCTVTISLVIGP